MPQLWHQICVRVAVCYDEYRYSRVLEKEAEGGPPLRPQVNMKLREYAEREHRVKQHPLESPSHQKVSL